jgi:hypothetical protein
MPTSSTTVYSLCTTTPATICASREPISSSAWLHNLGCFDAFIRNAGGSLAITSTTPARNLASNIGVMRMIDILNWHSRGHSECALEPMITLLTMVKAKALTSLKVEMYGLPEMFPETGYPGGTL